MRLAVYLLSVLTIVWATLSVPMPRFEIAPGDAPAIAPLIEIEPGADTTTINGALHLLTVSVSEPSLAEVVRAWSDDRRSLTRVDRVIPEGIERQRYFELQRQQFQLSFDIAAAVGARTAGYEVSLRTAPRVESVVADAPAQGVLEPFDVILEVDGTPVGSSVELVERTRSYDAGDTIALTIQRGDDRLEVQVPVGQVAGMPRPGLGIGISDIAVDVEVPIGIDLGPTRIGGPSAGMMIALTVHDLLSEEDVARGRIIAGTGTISFDGSVGPVSGVESKVAAAERIGAQIMLVPPTLVDDARAARQSDMRIVGVATLDEALAALRR